MRHATGAAYLMSSFRARRLRRFPDGCRVRSHGRPSPGLLLIVSLGVWSQIFRLQEPHARDVAQMVASVVDLTRTALINADADRRTDLLIELAALEHPDLPALLMTSSHCPTPVR